MLLGQAKRGSRGNAAEEPLSQGKRSESRIPQDAGAASSSARAEEKRNQNEPEVGIVGYFISRSLYHSLSMQGVEFVNFQNY